jgi:ERF superfamily
MAKPKAEEATAPPSPPSPPTQLAQQAPPAISPIEAMISAAVDKALPVETIEKLVGLYQKLKAEEAKQAYAEDMAQFQAECPVIHKSAKAEVNTQRGNYEYHYAPLEDIIAQTAPLRAKYGFSYKWEVRYEANPAALIVTCIVTHRKGHSDSSDFRSPIDSAGRMNVIQQSASSLTYGRRYSLTSVFGIATGEQDDDGRAGGIYHANGQAAAAAQGGGGASSPGPSGDLVTAEGKPTPKGGWMALAELNRSLPKSEQYPWGKLQAEINGAPAQAFVYGLGLLADKHRKHCGADCPHVAPYVSFLSASAAPPPPAPVAASTEPKPPAVQAPPPATAAAPRPAAPPADQAALIANARQPAQLRRPPPQQGAAREPSPEELSNLFPDQG